jgi:hypothetical protein
MDIKTRYYYKSKEVEQKLIKLKRIIRKHNQVFDKNSQNPRYLGDLINLDNRLDEVLHFTRG